MKPLSLLLLFTFIGLFAQAQNLDLRTERKEDTSTLGVSVENGNFKLDQGGEIKGSGLKVDFSHSFNNALSMNMYLASAFESQSGGVQSSFTGIGGYLYYTVFGNCCASQKTTFVGGQPIVTEKNPSGGAFKVGFGIDQDFLNGSKAVYSASGIGLGARYEFNIFSYRFAAATRFSTMTASQSKVQGVFYSFGVLFPL